MPQKASPKPSKTKKASYREEMLANLEQAKESAPKRRTMSSEDDGG